MFKLLHQTRCRAFGALSLFLFAGVGAFAQSDDCATPTPITINAAGACGFSSGTNVGSTDGALPDPSCDGGSAGSYSDVWYTFTTGATTAIDLTLNQPGNFGESVNFEIYTDCNTPDGLNCMLTFEASGTYPLDGLAASTSYLIRIWSNTDFESPTTFDLCLEEAGPPPPAPANDLCANAEAVTVFGEGLCVPVNGTTDNATEDSDPSCDGGTTNDVWYSFNTGTNTDLMFTVTLGTAENVGIEFFDACGTPSTGPSTTCNFLAGNVGIVTGFTAATTYLIRIWTNLDFEDPGTFTLCIEELPTTPPANDLCASAEAVTVFASGACVPTSGTTFLATEDSDPVCDPGTTNDVWYSFNTGTETAFDFTITLGTASFTGIEFFDACGTPATGILDAGCDFAVGDETNNFSGFATGTTYLFRIFTNLDFDSPGDFQLCIELPPPPPANDDCTDAIEITCPSNIAGTTVNATLDSESDCTGTGSGMTGVWYFIDGTDEEITIDLCNPTTDYDTQISVYEGTCGSLTCYAGNDDGGDSPCDLFPPFEANFKSRVTFNAFLGTTYYVLIHGFSDFDFGNFQMDISCSPLCLPLPGNDACASADPLTVGTTCVGTAGTNMCSTPTAGLGAPDCMPNFFGSYNDVWYSFVALDDAHDVSITLGSSTAVTVAFYATDDCSPAALTAAYGGCITWPTDVPDGESALITDLVMGDTYYLRVTTDLGDEGTFDVCVWDNPCSFPTDVLLDDVDDVSFTISWNETGTASAWDIYYEESPAGITPDEFTVPTINNTTNPATISGLDAETCYTFWIRSDNPGVPCTSVWTGPFEVCTEEANPEPGDFPSNAIQVPYSGNAYPSCGVITIDYSNMTFSPESFAPFIGPDMWLRVTAISNAMQVSVNGTSTDDIIQLFDDGFNLLDYEDVGLVNADIERMNFDGLTAGDDYYILISDFNANGGLVNICVRHFAMSSCDDGPGAYELCQNFKPDYTGANLYTFNFTQTTPSAGPTTTASHTGQISLGTGALALQHGNGYDVTIDGTFNVTDGVGNPETIDVEGTEVCSITINPHADLRTKVAQRCPATVLKGTHLQGKPVGSSRVDLQACKLEYSIVSPK